MAFISPHRGRPHFHAPERPTLPPRRLSRAAVAAGAFLALSAASAAHATTLTVPTDFSHIQDAVDASSSGDTVQVMPGTYNGARDKDVDLEGKSITVKSTAGAATTIIDLGGSSASPHRAFWLHNNEGSGTVIQGFTIKNGFQDFGAAILASSSGSTSPTIVDCIFLNNTATVQGGAIAVDNGSPTISRNVFIGNQAWTAAGDITQVGGAIEITVDNQSAQTVTIANNSFKGNRAGDDGGAIDVTSFDGGGNAVSTTPVVNFDNNSFSGNIALGDGAVLDASHQPGTVDFYGGKATLSNNILFGDTTPTEISTLDPPGANAVVQFNDIQGGYSGPGGSGNVNTDPSFVGAAAGNLELTALSTQLNAGTAVSTTPSVDLLGNLRSAAHFSRGAYEFAFNIAVGPFTPSQGINYNASVATFDTTSLDVDNPSDFTATIDWGDATVTAGTVTQPGGSGTQYFVSGSHTYTTGGAKTVTVTVTDSNPVPPAITGVGTGAITVTQAAATGFVVSAPASTTFGNAFSFTVTAVDGSNNTITGYGGTVHFSSSDGSASLPADTTLTNGVGTFNATLNTIGSQTITATDTVTSSITGTSGAIDVQTGPATHFTVSTPSTATAGVAFNATVTALDSANHTVTGYTGTVHFTTTSSSYNLPADGTLTNGTGTFSVKLNTAGNMTLTAEDAANNSINGTSANIAVSAGAAGFFNVVAPSTAIAGVPFNITVNAFDSFGNAATTYTGPVSFNSGDPLAVLPPNSSLVAGTGTFSVTLNTVGTQSIDSHDVASPGITGNTGPITVSPAGATHFAITVPSTSVAGSAISFTVTALDAADSVVPTYKGTVHFTSSDPRAVLPANVKLVNGTGTFSATLKTAGADTITATDTVTAGITGTSKADNVTAAAPARFRFYIRSTVATGNPEPFSLQAQDLYGNPTPSYSGTVHFTSTDGAATLPGDLTLVGGVGLSSVTFATPGAQTLTATDTLSSGITSGVPVTVTAMPAVAYKITAPASVTKGTPFTVTVTAIDANYHVTPAYSGTVHFTSTDPTASLPADATLTNGVGTFSVTLNKAGRFSINAQDTVTATIKGQAPNVIAH